MVAVELTGGRGAPGSSCALRVWGSLEPCGISEKSQCGKRGGTENPRTAGGGGGVQAADDTRVMVRSEPEQACPEDAYPVPFPGASPVFLWVGKPGFLGV